MGTDTPPEKMPHQIFLANFKANEETRGGDSSLFSSIMHKFVKVENRQDVDRRFSIKIRFDLHHWVKDDRRPYQS
ncbi:hypothetical protein Ddye_023383 [Dipteronia dyeriana]|uniref:Uncharacterized protein n=1 Tax=Dipteronia dyeriana TaxID=168575 RepID=A0AAD9TTU9_9ROSI|nr:hypothetical protein Ddye_023383 [Dipteronia dyeriana]